MDDTLMVSHRAQEGTKMEQIISGRSLMKLGADIVSHVDAQAQRRDAVLVAIERLQTAIYNARLESPRQHSALQALDFVCYAAKAALRIPA